MASQYLWRSEWRLSSRLTIYRALCPMTFLFASSEFCKKPSRIQQNTAKCGSSKHNCGERKVRFISRLKIREQALISKRQREAAGLALSACESGLNWWTAGSQLSRGPNLVPRSTFGCLSVRENILHGQPAEEYRQDLGTSGVKIEVVKDR